MERSHAKTFFHRGFRGWTAAWVGGIGSDQHHGCSIGILEFEGSEEKKHFAISVLVLNV